MTCWEFGYKSEVFVNSMGSKEIKKACSILSTNLLKWKLASKEGKLVLDRITEKLYGVKEDEEPETSKSKDVYDEVTQRNCFTLADILTRMRDTLAEMETAEDRCVGLSQLADMSSNSLQRSSNTSLLSSSTSQVSGTQSSSMIELETSVLYPSELVNWSQTIIGCHRTQLGMNEEVARSLCHLDTREEALFHVGVWATQPGLTLECEVAMVAVENTLKQCP